MESLAILVRFKGEHHRLRFPFSIWGLRESPGGQGWEGVGIVEFGSDFSADFDPAEFEVAFAAPVGGASVAYQGRGSIAGKPADEEFSIPVAVKVRQVVNPAEAEHIRHGCHAEQAYPAAAQ